MELFYLHLCIEMHTETEMLNWQLTCTRFDIVFYLRVYASMEDKTPPNMASIGCVGRDKYSIPYGTYLEHHVWRRATLLKRKIQIETARE